MSILQNLFNGYGSLVVRTSTVFAVLLAVLFMAAYEFAVYRLVSHRAFYNKSFNISISIIPFFISTIILCLQSNVVITLGTIGALAIIRFRTAVKNPVDMVYLLWSIHIGITCGCQLYMVAIITSLFATIVLLIMENVSFGKKPLVLVAHMQENLQCNLESIVGKYAKNYKVKSRNYNKGGVDYIIELSVSDIEGLSADLRENQIAKFSLIEYDSDDII